MDASQKIVRGNCLWRLPRMADESVDAFVTDPPFGINLNLNCSKHHTPRRIAGDGRAEARRLWAAFIPHAARLARPDTAHLFFSDYKAAWVHDLLAQHFIVKGAIVWDKRRIGLGWYVRHQFELAWYCHKGRPPRPAKAPSDLWSVSRVAKSRHPAEKPVGLLARAIDLVLPPERRDPTSPPLVCDPFAGIGSTAVAAARQGVRFLGFEIDLRYVRLARQRLAAERGTSCPS